MARSKNDPLLLQNTKENKNIFEIASCWNSSIIKTLTKKQRSTLFFPINENKQYFDDFLKKTTKYKEHILQKTVSAKLLTIPNDN